MSRPTAYTALCVHWDHHPVDAAQHYGAGTNAEAIRSYLRAVQPDVTQYHTIGCKGYVNYPSAVAPVVPGLVGDPLRVWADACAAEGVAFGCYAASFACDSPDPHPRWRCVNQAGVVSEHDYCPNGPWTEQFFIPLLLEVIERYHPVHFWLDGTWLPRREDHCCCAHCREKFRAACGRDLPDRPAPEDWIEMQAFYESSLDHAIARISRAIKQHDPHIQLACNSLYYFKDLRPPIHEVDWLSWDVLNTPNLHQASFEATYLTTAGKPADIMIYENGIVRWHPRLLRRPRTTAQWEAEAGTLMAHGCRVNLWHDPAPDGAVDDAHVERGRRVAAYVRERQDWCIGNHSLAEVAILASRQDHCLDPNQQSAAVRAAHQLLQEAHVPCNVVREDTLLNRLQQYRLVVLPETRALELDTAQWLHQFAMDGGSVLLVASPDAVEPAAWLEALLGPAAIAPGLEDRAASAPEWRRIVLNGRWVEIGHPQLALRGAWQTLAAYENGQPWLARLTVGDGAVFAIAGPALAEYAETHWPGLRDAVAAAILAGIGPGPLVELAGAPGVEVVVNRRDSDIYVHLVNLTPGASFGAPDEVFFDSQPVYHDLTVIIRPPNPPTHVIAMPGETPLRFAWADGAAQVTVPELRAHLALRMIGAAGAS